MGKLVLIDGFMVEWLFYGNRLYYSVANNCEEVPSMMFANQFMGCILFIGYMMMAMYFIILVTLPFLYIYVRNQMN